MCLRVAHCSEKQEPVLKGLMTLSNVQFRTQPLHYLTCSFGDQTTVRLV